MNRINILECGSGQSTIAIADRLRSKGNGKIYSLEDNIDRFNLINRSIQQHELQDFCEIIHAPLIPCFKNISSSLWYEIAEFNPSEAIDILIVDGPAALTKGTTLSRYPALSQLKKFLAEDAIVFLDDTDRDGEAEILNRWLSENPDFQLDGVQHSSCAQLKRSISASMES